MYSLTALSSFIIVIPLILLILASFLFKKIQTNFQLLSPFECGFNPSNSSRAPFSLQFFLLAILFLIFDVEITLLLPIPLIYPLPSSLMSSFTLIFFLVVLLLGVILEWYLKTLDWTS